MDFRHLIVTCLFSKLRLPFDNQKVKENYAILLQKTYKFSNQNMEVTWRNMLNEQSKYIIIDPQELMSPIKSRYPELYNYLKTRYYDK